jgi:hypothetical protein
MSERNVDVDTHFEIASQFFHSFVQLLSISFFDMTANTAIPVTGIVIVIVLGLLCAVAFTGTSPQFRFAMIIVVPVRLIYCYYSPLFGSWSCPVGMSSVDDS